MFFLGVDNPIVWTEGADHAEYFLIQMFDIQGN